MSCEIPVSSGRSEESSVERAQSAGDRQPRALRLECKCKCKMGAVTKYVTQLRD